MTEQVFKLFEKLEDQPKARLENIMRRYSIEGPRDIPKPQQINPNEGKYPVSSKQGEFKLMAFKAKAKRLYFTLEPFRGANITIIGGCDMNKKQDDAKKTRLNSAARAIRIYLIEWR